MFTFYTPFGSSTLQAFNLLLILAITMSLGASLYARRGMRAALADVYLGILVGAIIGARAGHILLNAAYFADHWAETLRVNAGGLDWHGAVIGGLIGLLLAARRCRVDYRLILADLALALPLLAGFTWWGCLYANCGYGAEVDTLARYPALLVAELPDVYGLPAPRYNTQLMGMVIAALLLLWVLIMRRRAGPNKAHFWPALALLSLAMFAIGFLRADYATIIIGLRADQWLDLLILALALWQGIGSARSKGNSVSMHVVPT